MLRSVRRTVGAGGAAQEHLPNSITNDTSSSSTTNYKRKTSNALSLSSPNTSNNSSSTTLYNPFHVPTWLSSPTCSSENEFDEWEYFAKSIGFNFDDHFVFGSTPSPDEVQHALSSLHRVIDLESSSNFIKENAAYDTEINVADHTNSQNGFRYSVSSCESDANWMEPSLQLCNSRMSNPFRSDKFYDAFGLLQAEPSVQRMVLSLSSDKAVWDAVMKNEVVREISESLCEAENDVTASSYLDESDDLEAELDVLSWIFINTRGKIMEVIEKITKMVDVFFLSSESKKRVENEKDGNSYEEKLKTSFLLCIAVFLVVVMTRATRADHYLSTWYGQYYGRFSFHFRTNLLV